MLTYTVKYRILDPLLNVFIPQVRGVKESKYTKVLGDVGECEISTNGEGLPNDIDSLRDYYIVALLSAYLDGAYLGTVADNVYYIKYTSVKLDQDGRLGYVIRGLDFNFLLDSRLVAYRKGSSQSLKTDNADDMMKDFVRDNLGANSGTDYDGASITDRQVSGLLVEDDTSSASSISAPDASFQNLLRVLQGVQANTAVSGSEVYFSAFPSGSFSPVFRTATGLWGVDKSEKVLFSPERGNLISGEEVYDYTSATTTIYISENGNADSQRINNYDSSLTKIGDHTRRESWASLGAVQAGTATYSDQSQSVADENLTRRRPKIRFLGNLSSNQRTPYLFNAGDVTAWSIGDKVAARINRERPVFKATIRAVQVTQKADGTVSPTARVETVA